MSELVTANELAKRLKIRPETVKVWARMGRIPAIRLSPKTLRFDPAAVLAALGIAKEKGGAL